MPPTAHELDITAVQRDDPRPELLRRMLTIRGFEQRVSKLYAAGEVPGFVHLSIGQEATAVGACWPLRSDDVITSTHRGHAHCLAKGLDPLPMFAELMAKHDGSNHGRGGSMHIADPSLGVFGANGIVGAGLPIANGAATAAQLRGEDSVAVAFFGDGAVAQGAFHESVNLAAVWKLPVIFFCENNGYAEFSAAAEQHRATLDQRALGYGVPYSHVDGNDVVAVIECMAGAVARCRSGRGPQIIEATTYRWHGHYEGDPQRYRTKDEVAEQQQMNDPIVRLREAMVADGFSESALDDLTAEVDKRLGEAARVAGSQPEPQAESLLDHVTKTRPTIRELEPVDTGEVFRTMDAIHDALSYEMTIDPTVFIAGIDVGAGGNVFGLTRGLFLDFPGRVRDTPISETAVMGVGVGAAMAGMRPVVEIMYLDFVGVCLDQIMNQAAKLPYMTGGKSLMSLVVRTQFGAGRSSGAQHSQSLEAILAHIPGLTVVMPSTPADTYGLLRAAIHDPNPVIFIENRLQYGSKGPKPPTEHLVPIGKAKIVRPGRDLTVVSVSRMVHECLAAADALAAEGIELEVIDLRTVAPLDHDTILASVERTGRLLIAHEAVVPFGIGAEIAAVVADRGFWFLDAPVVRLGAAPSPAPYAPLLEHLWLLDRNDIARAAQVLAHA